MQIGAGSGFEVHVADLLVMELAFTHQNHVCDGVPFPPEFGAQRHRLFLHHRLQLRHLRIGKVGSGRRLGEGRPEPAGGVCRRLERVLQQRACAILNVANTELAPIARQLAW